MRSVPAAILAVLLMLSACDTDGAPDPPGQQQPPQAACPDQDEAISRAETVGEPLVGDVTGDGRDDVVTVVVDPEGRPGCQAFLWLEHGEPAGQDTSDVLAIEQAGMEVGGVADLPRPVALVEIDDRPGAEIVLILIVGAATEFGAVFSYGGGSLARMEAEGGESFGGLFPHGGSAAQRQASDCIRGGEVIASGAVPPSPESDRLLVTRTFFVREGEAFLADLSRTELHREVPLRRLGRFPEFTGGLFAGCPPA